MKKNDIIMVVGILVIAAALYAVVSFYRTNKDSDYVVVYVNGIEKDRFLLDQDAEYDLEYHEGEKNHLSIKNKVATITEANCSDEVCVYQSDISKNGEMIVCLPHQLLIQIESSTESDTDFVAN